jgi:hypothetical protein
MAFSPATLQTSAVDLIQAAALTQGNALAGITVAVEGVNEPLDATIEPALRTNGQAIAVCFPDFTRRTQGGPGVAILQGSVPIFLFVNPTQNAKPGGLQREPLLVVEAIWRALAGKPASLGPHHFEPSAQPLERITDQAGLLVYALEFEAPVTITNN